jgi:hypothetical protein
MAIMMIVGTMAVVSILSLLNGAECGNLTCSGCRSNASATEYFCHGSDRYLFFRCESKSIQLSWDVSPLFEDNVILGPLNVGNIIHSKGIDIFVDFTDPEKVRIVSYLLLNLGALTSDVNVSCNNGQFRNKTMKMLRSVAAPTSGKAAIYSTAYKKVVLYQWSHDNPETVLCYNTKTYINETTLISNITLPSGSVNGSTNITQTTQGTIHLDIEAVGLCHHTATHSIEVECKFCF